MNSPKKLKVLIFSLIGVFNTLFDLALYAVIYHFSNSIIIANISATSAALIGSYLLNSRLTFRAKKWTFASFAGFVGVTVFGLWVLQTTVIYLLTPPLHHIPEHMWQLLGPAESVGKTLAPKVLATGVTLVWNYVWYNKVIFKNASRAEQIELAAE